MRQHISLIGLLLAMLSISQLALAQQPQYENYEEPKNPKGSWPVSHKQFEADPYAAGDVSRFMFEGWSGPAIPVWAYVPAGVDVQQAPILIMMHGAKRNPARYLLEWAPYAQEHGFVVVAPEIGRLNFKGSRRYNRGNVLRKVDGEYLPIDESQWSFSVIEPLFDHTVAALKSQQTAYTIYGHSAGAQFVHRYMYYKPQARVKRYLAANSGWYTLPDPSIDYPYGLKDTAVSNETLLAVLAKPVLVLLGDQDIKTNSRSLNTSSGAMLQGEHRYNRGATFMRVAREQATELGVKFGWRALRVKGVGHSNSGIAKAAAPFVR